MENRDNTLDRLKQLTEELEEAEIDLSRFFAVSPDLMCIVSANGYFLKINKAWEETLGYKEDELLKSRFIDFVHPNDVEITKAILADMIATDESTSTINRYRHKDGSYRTLEWHSTPFDENGKAYAIARDITFGMDKRMKAGEGAALRLNRLEQYITVINDALDAIEKGGNYLFRDVLSSLLGFFESSYGFMGYLNPRGDMICYAADYGDVKKVIIPKDIQKTNALLIKALKEKRGLIINKFHKSYPLEMPIHRGIAVPIMYKNNVIGAIKLVNKPSDYVQDDIDLLSTIARILAPVLNLRLNDLIEEERLEGEEG